MRPLTPPSPCQLTRGLIPCPCSAGSPCPQILTGSPWLLPRPLFVLAQEAALPLLGGEAQATLHCLPTRIAQQGVQDELADVRTKGGG